MHSARGNLSLTVYKRHKQHKNRPSYLKKFDQYKHLNQGLSAGRCLVGDAALLLLVGNSMLGHKVNADRLANPLHILFGRFKHV